VAMRQHFVSVCNHPGLLGNRRARTVGRPVGTGSGRGGGAQGAEIKYMYNELLPQQQSCRASVPAQNRDNMPVGSRATATCFIKAEQREEDSEEAGVRWRVYAAVLVTIRVLLSRR
jgi:hypothetical protein